ASYEGVLFEKHNFNGINRWLLPMGVYHRTRRRKGITFCPLCLFDDEEPYFRRRWRLALSTVCETHGSLMLDACPSCEAPVMYFRRELGHRDKAVIDSLALCHNCGFDLRRGPAIDPPGPDGKTLAILRSLNTFHDMGWWYCGDETQHYGFAYFDVLHHLATYLTSAPGTRLLKLAECDIGQRILSTSELCRMPLEQRAIQQRHRLLTLALWLLDDWPQRFVTSCRRAGLTSSRIMRSETFPFWFQSVVESELAAGIYMLSPVEIQSAVRLLESKGQPVTIASVSILLGKHRGTKTIAAALRGRHDDAACIHPVP
ncbi:MAG: TniQ family protein, partial [Spirochaetia bacterium]|nr:TniQ family protein [Spirochaetia bacterium]